MCVHLHCKFKDLKNVNNLSVCLCAFLIDKQASVLHSLKNEKISMATQVYKKINKIKTPSSTGITDWRTIAENKSCTVRAEGGDE